MKRIHDELLAAFAKSQVTEFKEQRGYNFQMVSLVVSVVVDQVVHILANCDGEEQGG